MDKFNQGNQQEDYDSYIYQSSNDGYQHQNFLYEDSCVFLHDYKDDESCQEKLMPKLPINNDEWQETDNQASYTEAFDETGAQKEETEKKYPKINKKKIIEKPPKQSTKKPTQKNKTINSKPKGSGNPSKFNNFGSFLIGSVSEILSKGRNFKIEDGAYKICIFRQYITICQTKLQQNEVTHVIFRKLKKDIEHVPRKQGAKKHLFRLVNKGATDNEERKEFKRLIREELIYHLSQQPWLQEHVNSRDFQPKGDDPVGSKKKERHEAYLIYLTAIRQALINKGELPKRLTL